MPQDSKRKRHLRRVKREKSLAYRMLSHVLKERNDARSYALGLERIMKQGLADVVADEAAAAAPQVILTDAQEVPNGEAQ